MSRRPDGRTIRKSYLPAIRVTPRFKAAVERRAWIQEKTVTSYIRELIEKDLESNKPG